VRGRAQNNIIASTSDQHCAINFGVLYIPVVSPQLQYSRELRNVPFMLEGGEITANTKRDGIFNGAVLLPQGSQRNNPRDEWTPHSMKSLEYSYLYSLSRGRQSTGRSFPNPMVIATASEFSRGGKGDQTYNFFRFRWRSIQYCRSTVIPALMYLLYATSAYRF